MELDDPSDVAIVTCADGTILLRASASKVLLRHLGKRGADDNDDDDDDDDSSNQRKPKAGADKATAGKRKVAPATSKAATSKATTSKAARNKAATTSKVTTDGGRKRKAATDVDSERPAKRRSAQVPEPTEEEQDDRIECCYMYGSKVSKSFWVDELSSYEGEPNRVQRYTYYYSKNRGEWTVCPTGVEPLLSEGQEAYCEVYRMNLGLINDRS